jgi:Membrane bound beta barrel domain (DUF5777)
MTKHFCFLLFAFCFSAALRAQEQYVPVVPLPLGDTLLSLPTSHIPTDGTWELKFTHRFNQSLDQGNFSDRVHSLWGLDSNADVMFGASWTPRRDFQLSLMRTNAMDDVELALKYIVVQQAPAVPFSVALRAGGDWRTERDLNDRSSAFAQLVLSRQLGKRAELFVIPTYATNAGRAVAGNTSQALFKHAANAPVGLAVMVRPQLSVVAEFIPKNRDLPKGTKADPAWALGLKRAIGGHYFEILVTNSNATMVDQYVSSTYQGAALNKSDLHLGFNIERRFGK